VSWHTKLHVQLPVERWHAMGHHVHGSARPRPGTSVPDRVQELEELSYEKAVRHSGCQVRERGVALARRPKLDNQRQLLLSPPDPDGCCTRHSVMPSGNRAHALYMQRTCQLPSRVRAAGQRECCCQPQRQDAGPRFACPVARLRPRRRGDRVRGAQPSSCGCAIGA
jgi:hypothetical protein